MTITLHASQCLRHSTPVPRTSTLVLELSTVALPRPHPHRVLDAGAFVTIGASRCYGDERCRGAVWAGTPERARGKVDGRCRDDINDADMNKERAVMGSPIAPTPESATPSPVKINNKGDVDVGNPSSDVETEKDEQSDHENDAPMPAFYEDDGVIASTEITYGGNPQGRQYLATVSCAKEKAYLSMKRDMIFEWTNPSQFAYKHGAYTNWHKYTQNVNVDFFGGREPGYNVVNLARIRPGKLIFGSRGQTSYDKADTLMNVDQPREPVFCVTTGPKGIDLAPFEEDIYRVYACLNDVAKKSVESLAFPMYESGTVHIVTKNMLQDLVDSGGQPRRGPNIMRSAGGRSVRRVGVLEFADDIPVLDSRGACPDWNECTTFADICGLPKYHL
ncbi:hypothetical protein BD626DRAFT_567172 [Schizophyllum amplum]|uniref:Uncharacterized protein n=1 Tax=Schizophyllum amplum TaxID=97359 RepID=A0A550CKC0_9AGAR|nr:hypothetical protein BD626DRAFT_567172 [Auriculariopsis ampla]